MARICARPNCSGVVSFAKATGFVKLDLEKSADSNELLLVDAVICGNCSVDLIEWWNRGKK